VAAKHPTDPRDSSIEPLRLPLHVGCANFGKNPCNLLFEWPSYIYIYIYISGDLEITSTAVLLSDKPWRFWPTTKRSPVAYTVPHPPPISDGSREIDYDINFPAHAIPRTRAAAFDVARTVRVRNSHSATRPITMTTINAHKGTPRADMYAENTRKIGLIQSVGELCRGDAVTPVFAASQIFIGNALLVTVVLFVSRDSLRFPRGPFHKVTNYRHVEKTIIMVVRRRQEWNAIPWQCSFIENPFYRYHFESPKRLFSTLQSYVPLCCWMVVPRLCSTP